MQITVEISFYPLKENFGPEVLDVIGLLRRDDLEVRTNNMSTQITGEYDRVFETISGALKESFSKDFKASAVLKVFNQELDLKWI